MEYESALKRINLDGDFGVALSVVGLALLLAPYLQGSDFGVVKIPTFEPHVRKVLRIVGPLAMFVVVMVHVDLLPIGPQAQLPEAPAPSIERELREELWNGAVGQIIFDVEACEGSKLGTIQCGYLYFIQFNRATNSWTMKGNNRDGILIDEERGTYTNAKKERGNLSAWGIRLTFFANGEVRRDHQTIGKLELLP